MNFVTIDFETANQYSQSACSVGLARFDGDGILLDTFYSLIKPPAGYDRFLARNTEIHGLRAEDVADAPDFGYLWPEIELFIGSDFLVAHNAEFDMGILRGLFSFFGIAKPDLRYFCSLRVSRKVWPSLESHALTWLSAHFNLEYNAHNALDDAINCGKIFSKCCNGKLYDFQLLRKFLIVRGIEIKRL